MLKNIAQLEHVVEGKVYRFLCDGDSPLAHVKDALCQFMAHCALAENSVKSQAPVAEVKAVAAEEPVSQPEEQSDVQKCSDV